ncbi:MAG: type II toxin-antitoxin system PemK/MazF family toxin [Bifidobacteriaceae bacterium]|jgi:mRNA interferase MazF|nr:type II toxin-antitoxin system PemK/MazF family toxin [Bifidobacteriaceae bacterium]
MKPSTESARRGEVWLVALGAARAGEIGKNRPALIMSVDWIGTGDPKEPVIVVPFTCSRAPSPLRPRAPVEIGLEVESVALCRAVRSVARARLLKNLGDAPTDYVDQVAALVSAMIGGPRDTAAVPPPTNSDR